MKFQTSIPKAFSLIEMLVVLAIIGILLSAGLPLYRGYVQEARATQAAISLFSLDNHVAKYVERQRGDAGYESICTYLRPILDQFNTSDSYHISCTFASRTDFNITLDGKNHLLGLKYELSYNSGKTLAVPDGWNFTGTVSCLVVNPEGTCMASSSI